MPTEAKSRPGLSIAAVLVMGEALWQVALPPFAWWEVAVILPSLVIAWGLLRASRVAWGVAAFGACGQLAYGLAASSVAAAIAAVLLLALLLWAAAQELPSLAAAERAWPSPLALSFRFEELAGSVGRVALIRGACVTIGLFFLTSVVGYWHDHLHHDTTATEIIWGVVVTSFRLALVGMLFLVLTAIVGARLRKRQP